MTIVAFNGVQRRAKETVLKSDLAQASRQLAVAIVETGAYPVDLGSAKLKASGDTTYQYTVNNSAVPPTFCLSVVSASMIGSAFRVSQDGLVSAGACPGHSTNPGYTNLLANPSAETTNGTSAIRRNLARDPQGTTTPTAASAGFLGWRATRWFGGGSGAGTYASLTGSTPLGASSYARKAWTATPPTNGDTGFDHASGGTSGVVVTAGLPVTVSGYLRPSTPKWSAVFISFYDSAGTLIGGRNTAPAVLLPAGEWTRVSHTFTAPAGSTYMYASSDINATLTGGATLWAPGDTLDGTGLLVEQANFVGSYFDGSTAAAGDFTHSWTGTANAATSEQRGVAIAGYTGNANYNYAAIFQSSSWSSSGIKSIGMVNRGAHNDQFLTIDNLGSVVQPDRTYTLIARVKTTKAISDTNQLRLRFNITGLGDRSYSSGLAGPAGEYAFRVVFDTTAMSGGISFFRLMNGINDPGLVTYWDSIALVEGDYTGPYFE